MADKLRLAMIGCGDISQWYLKAAPTTDCAEVVVVMDVNEAAAKSLGEEFGKEHTTDYKAVLGRDDVDAVIVSVPHYLHAPLAIQAAQAGKHVLCDKPIATNVADAKKMIEACRKAGVQLSVNFMARFASRNQKARELLAAGVIGEVLLVVQDERSYKPDTYWAGGWSGRVKTDWRPVLAKAGGGILIMNAIHGIDLVLYLTGLKPTWVAGLSDTFVAQVEVEDTVAAVIKLSNGGFWNILSASNLVGAKGAGTTIHGKLGQIQLGDPVRVYTTRTDVGLKANEWNEVPVPKDVQSYQPYLTATCKAILAGKTPPVTGADGLAALAVVRAVYESSQSGQPVKL